MEFATRFSASPGCASRPWTSLLDGRAFEAWCDAVADRDSRLLHRIVVQKSQSGGRHVIYRNELMTPGKTVLVRTISPNVSGKDTLIETLGEGSLVMCDPSPGYLVLQGELMNLPVMSIDERAIMVEAACPFNEAKPASEDSQEKLAKKISSDGIQPGDDFKVRGDVASVLSAHGIQEEILFLPKTVNGRDPIKEAEIRPIAKTLDWKQQRNMWRAIKSMEASAPSVQ